MHSLQRFAVRVNRVVQYLSRDAFGGPRAIKLAWVINVQKGGTIPFIAALMVRHWIPWVILGAIWTFVLMTNIAAQEAAQAFARGPQTDDMTMVVCKVGARQRNRDAPAF